MVSKNSFLDFIGSPHYQLSEYQKRDARKWQLFIALRFASAAIIFYCAPSEMRQLFFSVIYGPFLFLPCAFIWAKTKFYRIGLLLFIIEIPVSLFLIFINKSLPISGAELPMGFSLLWMTFILFYILNDRNKLLKNIALKNNNIEFETHKTQTIALLLSPREDRFEE
jgi:hypothetical protein